jgi:hypothetical protein
MIILHPSPLKQSSLMKLIKLSKASGMDNLDTYILKLTRKTIDPSVCHILNLSIQNKKFSTKWKIAKVVPLYKEKGSTYMDFISFFNPNHHAYRSFHSTTTAMLQMYTTWLDALEQGGMAGVCMIDMSAAFDVVDTELLLEKLKQYGFDRNAIHGSGLILPTDSRQ